MTMYFIANIAFREIVKFLKLTNKLNDRDINRKISLIFV